jgi:dipeptidyl aminopeptidase/acylaminoacyl peptidase
MECGMTSFGDLRDFVAIPRLAGLRLSPDGAWLAAVIQTLRPDRAKYLTSLWRIETSPDGPAPVRLTRSAEGEHGPAFRPDSSLLFISARPSPDEAGAPARDDEQDGDAGESAAGAAAVDEKGPAGDPQPALWLLPARGGEARRVFAPPGGVQGVVTARSADTVLLTAATLTSAASLRDDSERRAARREAGVTAILHESGPVQYWDHDLGPDQPRLLITQDGPGVGEAGLAAVTELTPSPARALDEQSAEVTPDGSTVVTGWADWDAHGERTGQIMVIDAATGERRLLLAEPGQDFSDPCLSPDGRLAACLRESHDRYDKPGDVTLVVTALDGGGAADDVLAGFDRRPHETAWAPDSTAIYFTADDQGRCPVFRVDLASGDITRLTPDDGAYASLCPDPDGQYLYAIRSAVDEPPTPVRLDLTAAPAVPERLACPGTPLRVPGSVTEVEATAPDGVTVRSWLVLPEGASAAAPAPLLLWVHGGPLGSWNAWSWRWNPWLMAAQGYAVLLPDPALSTGYGQDFIARGHGQWGAAPYTDLMAITDAAQARPDIDADRTAMMGGSFGGYMANWIAGHTGRFQAIVTHASLWALDQMFGTTDLPTAWRRVYGDPDRQPGRYLENSPNRHVREISTPLLIIHGGKDYRVPIGEALRLWWDLQIQAKDAKFLYFPDENHWVLTPGNARVWYETVLAFLAYHVQNRPWQRPDLL